jgi:hypothetical protein
MKKIFLISLSAGFISTGFAQSSVADVPENKIKPAYDLAQPVKKAEPQQKQTPKNTVQTPVIITDKNSSLYEENKKEVAKAKPDVSGSVADIEPAKTVVKPVDNSGSVAPQAEVKKAEVKPVEVKGTSVEDVPNKPVEEKKKISNVPESTKTD